VGHVYQTARWGARSEDWLWGRCVVGRTWEGGGIRDTVQRRDGRTGSRREPIRCSVSSFRSHDSSDFASPQAIKRHRTRLRWGASPDEKVAAGASDGWADAPRGSTPRLTPGRIEPGVSTGASGRDETSVPGRAAPCGVGLRAAPAPPRTRCCWGSISRSRLASVVSYAPLLARTPTRGRDPHPCDGFAPIPG
jgi:hypothetical protein